MVVKIIRTFFEKTLIHRVAHTHSAWSTIYLWYYFKLGALKTSVIGENSKLIIYMSVRLPRAENEKTFEAIKNMFH